MVVILAAFSAFSFGCADFIGGYSCRKSPVSAVVVWSQAMGLPIALIAALVLNGIPSSFEGWFWGMMTGLAGAAGLGFLYHGLAVGLASVVSPTAAVCGAVLPVLFGFIMGERPEYLTWIGVAIAIPAICLLTIERGKSDGNIPESLKLGFFGGLGFGGFFIFLSLTGDGSGFWPLVVARTTSVPVLIAVILLRRKSLVLSPGSRISTIAAGVLDMTANIFYLFAARMGLLITASIIAAMYPAPTVILQRIIFREKITAIRTCALLLALCGIALISLD